MSEKKRHICGAVGIISLLIYTVLCFAEGRKDIFIISLLRIFFSAIVVISYAVILKKEKDDRNISFSAILVFIVFLLNLFFSIYKLL